MSIGLTNGSIKDVLEDIKKDMNIPDDDVIIIVHVLRKDVERVCGALELSGVTQQIGMLRDVRNRETE